jgi:hypothetical protein
MPIPPAARGDLHGRVLLGAVRVALRLEADAVHRGVHLGHSEELLELLGQ